MGRTPMKQDAVDFSDVQGLVRFGYGKMTEASYVLLRIKDAAAARRWLRAAPVMSAANMNPPPSTALQVAFTARGLVEIGMPKSVVEGFSPEFLAGMAEESRTRRLGDIGANAPSQWAWGYGASVPHLVAMFFAAPGGLANFIQDTTGPRWFDAFEEMRWLKTADLDGIEPFGFADGISQPQIDWARERDPTRPQIDYGNVVALGEFLLGYPNEYNKYTERPLLDPDPVNADLLPAEDAPEKKDLGRNGTYLVMRDLEQDVRAFWQFVSQQTAGNVAAGEKLAAAMVGRTRAGDPLVPIQQEPIPGIGSNPDEARQNRFTYAQDPTGSACPFGAHIRRANPRNPDFPGRPASLLQRLITMLGFGPNGFRDDLMSPVRFHRILRRGREYGPELLPEDALTPAPPDEPARGLHFVCLNANISRQFEFLQNAWIVNTKFSALTGESDPLLGTRVKIPGCPVTADFNQPRAGRLRQRVSDLPRFVTVRGGAYFFLPSLRALHYIASDRGR
jgi:deferrochelatase/peroxidase EfeB